MNAGDALGFLLVFLIGFAAHRARLCTVRAVMQWLGERKTSVLISFVKAAGWSSLMAGVFVLLGLSIKGVSQTHGVWWVGIFGGFLFGVGAAINGGCSLSTVQRLADGDGSLLLTLFAFVLGTTGTIALENFWLTPGARSKPLLWAGLTHTQQVALVSMLAL